MPHFKHTQIYSCAHSVVCLKQSGANLEPLPALTFIQRHFIMSNSLLFGVGLLPFPIASLFCLLSALPGNSYRSLSHSEYISLLYLNFPQSERAIVSRYGQPLQREGNYDYYPIENRGYARISYVGNRAQSFRVVVK